MLVEGWDPYPLRWRKFRIASSKRSGMLTERRRRRTATSKRASACLSGAEPPQKTKPRLTLEIFVGVPRFTEKKGNELPLNWGHSLSDVASRPDWWFPVLYGCSSLNMTCISLGRIAQPPTRTAKSWSIESWSYLEIGEAVQAVHSQVLLLSGWGKMPRSGKRWWWTEAWGVTSLHL